MNEKERSWNMVQNAWSSYSRAAQAVAESADKMALSMAAMHPNDVLEMRAKECEDHTQIMQRTLHKLFIALKPYSAPIRPESP